MRIISLDQSMRATAAVEMVVVEDGVLRIENQSICSPKSTGIFRLNAQRIWMQSIGIKQDVLLARELHNMRQFGNAGEIHHIAALIDLCAYDYGLVDGKYAKVSPSTWKKFITGKGSLKKDTAYMMHLNKALKKHPMIQFDEDVADDNIADAISIGVTAYAALMMKDGKDLPVSSESTKALTNALEKMFQCGKR